MSHRRRAALLSSSAMLAASLSVMIGSGPALAQGVDVGNPMAGNLGFNTIVHHDGYFGSTETEGTIAVGGDISWGDYNVDIHSTASYTAPGDDHPTALLVGGTDDLNGSTGKLNIQGGDYVKIAKVTGDVLDQGTRGTVIVKPGASYDSLPAVVLNGVVQSQASMEASVPLDFDSLFAQYKARAAEMDACATTVKLTDANGNEIDPANVPAGTNAYIAPTPGTTNVLHISGANLNNIANLTVRPALTTDTPLVIVVDGPSDFTWHTPNVSLPDKSSLSHLLWDFPQTTKLTLPSGSAQVQGTIYAPSAAVRDESSSNIEGDIAADSYHAVSNSAGSAGEIHYYPFSSDVSCGAEPTTAPPTTEAPTTTAPPTTEAPTTAAPTTAEPTSESPSPSESMTCTPTPTTAPPTTEPTTAQPTATSTGPTSTGPATTEPASSEPASTRPPTASASPTCSGVQPSPSGSELAETGGSSSTLPLAAGSAAVLAAGALLVFTRLRRVRRH